MSQAENFGVPLGPPADPYLMAQRISQSLAALLSLNSGPSRPAYAVAGTLHLSLAATPWSLDVYDGEQWINVLTIDPATHEVIFALEQDLDIDSIEGLPEALDALVPQAREIETEGLLSGGGTLDSNLTLEVPVASQGEAEAGADNETAMTPLRTAQAIAAQVPAASESDAGVAKIADTTAMESRAGGVIVTPENQHRHPLHGKAWGKLQGTGAVTLLGGVGISSVDDVGTGNYRFNWVVPFSSQHYCVTVGFDAQIPNLRGTAQIESMVAGSTRIGTGRSDTQGRVDCPLLCVAAHGDQ